MPVRSAPSDSSEPPADSLRLDSSPCRTACPPHATKVTAITTPIASPRPFLMIPCPRPTTSHRRLNGETEQHPLGPDVAAPTSLSSNSLGDLLHEFGQRLNRWAGYVELDPASRVARSARPITERVITSVEPAQVTESGPTVTQDDPGRRCEDGDRRWSRYERPFGAVDLTECAGTRVPDGACGFANMRSGVHCFETDRTCRCFVLSILWLGVVLSARIPARLRVDGARPDRYLPRGTPERARRDRTRPSRFISSGCAGLRRSR